MTGTKAIVYANIAVANADLDWTYREEGLDGCAVGVEYIDPAAASASLSFSYANGKVTVSLATNGGSTITTIASDISTAVNGVKASNTLTSNNSNPSVADTVKIGGTTYRFMDVTAQANDIFIGASADATLGSLVKVLNGTATIAASGADAFTGTKNGHALVSAANVSAHATVVTARFAGTPYNAIVATAPVGATFSWTAATFGAATAGVTPTAGWDIAKLFTVTNHGADNGSGTVTAMTVVDSESSGGTPGVGTTYDSVVTAAAAGWELVAPASGALTVQNDKARVAADGGQLTIYEGSIYNANTGGKHSIYADSAAHLLTAMKTYAIAKARAGQARDWSPHAYFPPTLWAV